MSITSTKLSFSIPESNSCGLLLILDTSVYLGVPSELVLQIKPPLGYPTKELTYYKNSVTVINSNSLGITHVSSSANYTDLPDGVWVAKISICPHETFWAEKKWYRTCQIRCKYHRAFLKLELNKCETCYNKQMSDRLDTAIRYIEGCEASAATSDWGTASSLYTVADKILSNILDCECKKGVNFSSNGCC